MIAHFRCYLYRGKTIEVDDVYVHSSGLSPVFFFSFAPAELCATGFEFPIRP